MQKDTKLLHGYPVIDEITGATSIPKYQTSTFHQKNFKVGQDYTYTRFGNPTIEAVETCIASLENATYGLAFSSGMAAISSTLLLLNAGDHIVLGKNIYGGAYQAVTQVLTKFKISYTFVDETNVEAWHQAIENKTKMFYIETPSNPLLTITDIASVCKMAKEHHILTVCDNTFMTPYLQNPLELGVDIVIHSGTKFLGGHSDVTAGLAATNCEDCYEKLHMLQKVLGCILSVEDAWLLLRGVKTLGVRMKQSCANAILLAEKLTELSCVKKVYYPSLATGTQGEWHQKQATASGAVLSIELDSVETVEKLFSQVTIPVVAVSLGGVESILSYPWTMSHACMPEEERLAMGVTPNLVRLSCGIEAGQDLLEDMVNALK